MRIEKQGNLEVIVFENLERSGMVRHCFTTRHGGVSTGVWASMNMGLSRGEDVAAVRENYRILGGALGFSAENFVTSQQTHTTNVKRVTAADAGQGVWKERCYADVDGLITDEKGIPLVIFGADCVPVFLLDRRHKAIGMAHCGWKGTGEGKYKIDLWETNRRLLADMGVEDIEVAGLCTMCDQERFYSHRGMGEKRGVMAGVMELR